MATHSSTLAWKIPWTEDPDRLQSMGSQRVGQDWATSLSLSLSLFGILYPFPVDHFTQALEGSTCQSQNHSPNPYLSPHCHIHPEKPTRNPSAMVSRSLPSACMMLGASLVPGSFCRLTFLLKALSPKASGAKAKPVGKKTSCLSVPPALRTVLALALDPQHLMHCMVHTGGFSITLGHTWQRHEEHTEKNPTGQGFQLGTGLVLKLYEGHLPPQHLSAQHDPTIDQAFRSQTHHSWPGSH